MFAGVNKYRPRLTQSKSYWRLMGRADLPLFFIRVMHLEPIEWSIEGMTVPGRAMTAIPNGTSDTYTQTDCVLSVRNNGRVEAMTNYALTNHT